MADVTSVSVKTGLTSRCYHAVNGQDSIQIIPVVEQFLSPRTKPTLVTHCLQPARLFLWEARGQTAICTYVTITVTQPGYLVTKIYLVVRCVVEHVIGWYLCYCLYVSYHPIWSVHSVLWYNYSSNLILLHSIMDWGKGNIWLWVFLHWGLSPCHTDTPDIIALSAWNVPDICQVRSGVILSSTSRR